MNLLHVLFSLSLIPFSYAYYGLLGTLPELKSGLFSTVFSIGQDIYSYGGYNGTVSKFGIDENKVLYARTFQVKDLDFNCFFCFSFVMSSNSVLTLTGYDNSVDVSNPYSNNMGVYYFNPIENTAPKGNNYKMLQGNPLQRVYHQAVITPDKKSVYIFGGIEYTPAMNVSLGIAQFDILSSTFITHNVFTFVGGTATMLPSGIVVLAFGAFDLNQTDEKTLYDTTFVYLYDTNSNHHYKQDVDGFPPLPRHSASGTLGPDGECIYYFGGSSLDILFDYSTNGFIELHGRGKTRSDLIILNTTSWMWLYPNTIGPPSKGRHDHFSILYDDNRLVIGGGTGAYYNTQDDISVLINLPTSNETSGLDHLQWFTNSKMDDVYNGDDSGKFNPLTIIGIIISILTLMIIILYYIWKKIMTFKSIIWKRRIGEPVWTELARLVIRFILLGILLSYIVYAIVRALNSPSLNQEQTIKKLKMPVPDIRVCSHPYAEFTVSCVFTNDHDCSKYFYPITNDSIIPSGDLGFHKPFCQVFIPPLDMYFQSNEATYIRELNNDIKIDFYGNDTNKNTDFYFTYYTTQKSPYRILFGMNAGDSEITLDDANNWLHTEQALPNSKDKFNTANGNWATTIYSLTETLTLTNSGWNYFGFANIYNTTLDLNLYFGPMFLVSNPSSVLLPTLMFRVKPHEYSIHRITEQKVSTIIGGLASAGGVFSAFVALQTILFGFRPNSPWGIIHRWSWGRQKETLRNLLRDQFNTNASPVPMVTRVRDEDHLLSEQSDSIMLRMLPFKESHADQTDRFRLKKIEDRIQLMEDIFKTYYINDEIFQILNEARKYDTRKHEENMIRASDFATLNQEDEQSLIH